MMNPLAALFVFIVSFFLCSAAGAQPYPAKPFAYWSASRRAARPIWRRAFLAQKLSETMGQQVIVENRPGAGSMLAAEVVARSTPDGYTTLVANVTVAMPSMFKKLPFDLRKDLAPVSLVGLGRSRCSPIPRCPRNR
jgi:tripartite-type tricarboxylate transporter receptor subunit TctC